VITIYIVSHCPHCAALVADLQRRRVRYRCIDVGRERQRLDDLKRLTWERRLPVVVDHERCSVGFCGGSSTWREWGLGE
jgi:glutaredoxin